MQDLGAISGFTAFHGLGIAFPMTLTLPLGNDQIQGLAQCFFLGKPKNTNSGGIPVQNPAADIAQQEGIPNSLAKLMEIEDARGGHYTALLVCMEVIWSAL
jgi:hypothetical protein